MKPQVYHVDAFTSQPFRGNSAGVVFPADNLSEAQMQLIARELGHSETAFLLHSDDSDVRIRYFTPTVEVPICGHATVAAHYVRAKVLGIPLKPEVDIDALSPDLAALTAISKQIGCNGFFPFQIRPGKSETDGRMFSPAIGIVEDPVTGNANGPMGAWLVHHNVLSHDGNVLRVKGHQGRALGRDGVIDVTVTIRDNQPEKVTISGTAVILFHAEWAIDF
ncbi:PhzF family phenazine biosynthesis isomerase [Escherichia coli]|nr:PhzF family phenazine biosynthesis isomerase [Escherichia coli]